MRTVLSEQLGVCSVFPSQTAPVFRRYFTGRAILEYDQNDKEVALMALDDVVEDIIIKVYDKESEETAQYQDFMSLSIRYILLKLFSKVSAHILDCQKLRLKIDIKPPSMALHPGIAVVYAYIETKENIIVIQEYAKHTALSVSRFHAKTTLSSPTLSKGGGLGTQDLRKRFILYQLLQIVSFLHLQGLCLDLLIPGNIMLDDDMWLTLPISISERACLAALYTMNKNSDKLKYSPTTNDEDSLRERTLSELPTKINFNNTDTAVDNKVVPLDEQFVSDWCQRYLSNMCIDRHPDYYEPVTIQWSKGKLGNFEYLMIINAAAGRSMVDPLYHPILPWVTDFSMDHDTLENSGYRDLSKTKFRLSKGDAQLETTYKHSDPPHHVPESISELTYYIYMARRTPMQVLRRVVRDVFVPEHYPHSVGRMYDWTPDECIPEFFTDNTVFQSIHHTVGLTDLELPSFASTPSDFISYHRRVIESDAVSKDLHKWIDLTFGHCLYGQAAIDNMNVPLRHTLSSADREIQGGSVVDKHPGFVMLFSDPHPCREYRHHNTSSQLSGETSTNIFKVSDMKSSLKGLLLLDKNKQVNRQYSGFNTTAVDSYPFNGSTSLPNSNIGSEKEREVRGELNGLVAQPLRQGSKNPTHYSLTSPQHDPTVRYLDKLRNALPVDMSSYHHQHILAKEQVDELAAVSLLHKFGDKFDRILNPTYKYFYKYCSSRQGNTPLANHNDPSKDEFWSSIEDKDFVQELLNSIEFDVKNDKSCIVSDVDPVDFLQNEDMFSIGCTICELFLGEPLLTGKDNHVLAYKHTDYLQYFREMIKIIYKRTSSLPLVIQRVVIALITVPSFKPKAHEILQACTAIDFGTYDDKAYGSERSGGNIIGFVDFKKDKISSSTRCDKSPTPSKSNTSSEVVLEENLRVNYLYNHCNRLFPSYFKEAYTIIGKIKLCRKSIDKILVLNHYSSLLVTIPLEGLSLLLPQILAIIGNPTPFQAEYKDAKLKFKVTGIYVGLLDVLGCRLGVEVTEKAIIPKVVLFFNNLMSAESLMDFLRSDLWAILIMRAGVKVFLSQLLPLLLTYLVSGTLYNVGKSYRETSDSRNSSVDILHQFSAYELNSSPLWAALQWNIDKKEWIQGCTLPLIRAVQKETVRTITSLCHSDLLGSGLTCRYVVPAIMCLVGVPSLAFAGSSNFHNNDDIHPRSFNTYVTTKCVFDHQNMYCVDCITLVASQIGERATADLILSKLFNSTLFKLEAEVNDTNNLRDKASVVAALMEIVWLLNALLPSMSRETVVNHFIKPSNVTEFSLPKLLATLPLPQWSGLLSDSATSDMESYKSIVENFSSYIDHYRLYSLQSELIHLMVNISKIADDHNICEKYVLPHVDTFFLHFIEAYSDIDIQSMVAEKAFELGASLFLPLVDLLGPEKFATAVHNLNPRLEMWLRAASDPNSPKTSPPLPSTILPETVVDSSRGATTGKKKGIKNGWKWLSEKSKVIFNTGSTAPTPSTPTVATTAPFNNINNDLSPLSERNAIVQRAQSLRTPSRTLTVDESKVVAGAAGHMKTAVPTPSIMHSVISPTEGMELSAIKLPQNIANVAPTTPYDSNQFLGSWHESRNEYNASTPIADAKSSRRSYTSSFKSSLQFEDNISDEDSDEQDSAISRNNAKNGGASEVDTASPTDDNSGSYSPKFNTDVMNQVSSFRKLLNGNKNNKGIPLKENASGKVFPRKHKSNSGVGAMLRGGAKLINNINQSYNGDVAGAAVDDEDDTYFSDYTWLLAGKGRWSNYINGLNNSEKDSGSTNYQHIDPYITQHPAAHLSMTAPRITVDAASETVEYINLSYMNTMTMPIEHETFNAANVNNSNNTNSGNDINNSIAAMICNSTESILVTSSISGVRTWSLNNHPISVVNKYTTRQITSNPPQNLGFLRCGTQLASCNSSTINIWDVETNQTLECLRPATDNSCYSYMKVTSPRYGVAPTLDSYGDDQIFACYGNTLSCHDFRSHSIRKLTPACEWNVPSNIPVVHSTSFITSSSNSNTEKVTITCANSNENYIFAGSNYGTIWVLDRRMGRILSAIQTYDSNNSSNKDIINISVLSDTCILAVADGYSAIYDYYYDNDEVKKLFSVKNMVSDGVHPIKHNNIFVHAYGSSTFNYGILGGGQESFIGGSNTAKSFALYCAAGHKVYSTRIPTLERDSSRDKINLAPYSTSPERFIYYNNIINNDNTGSDTLAFSHNVSNSMSEEIKLNFSYITDRTHSKVSKTKLHTTSMALLPLRKLLLLGTMDGSIRVVI